MTKSQKIKKNKNTRWIISTGIIAIIIFIVILNFSLVRLGYYYLFKIDHFSPGDKVYESKMVYDMPHIGSLGALRLIRPLTQKDIDAMVIDSYEEKILRKSVDSTLKPYIRNYQIHFKKSDMIKAKSAFMGAYVKTIFSDGKDIKGNKYFDVFYVIKPNKSVFHEEEAHYKYDTPKGYVLADSNIYVTPNTVSATELATFK